MVVFVMVKNKIVACLFSILLLLGALPAWAGHGYALWGDLKYPADFTHFDYVNPDAPRGGELVLVSNLRVSTFDKYNPFSLKGSEPAYMGSLVFETLLTGSLDESGSAYGLLAQDVEVAPDRSWVRFRLNPAARFHNGDAVLAKDVIHSYSMLVSDQASPAYRTVYAAVAGVRMGEDEREVYFDLNAFEPQIPLDIGGLPVFSHKWGEGKSFGEITLDVPLGSGPYRIGPVDFGRDITYVRDPDYWGNDLNVRRGQFNFDRITVRIYKDETAKLEAFKAGEFDFMQEFSAGNWARQYRGKRFDSGDIVKRLFEHRMPSGFQGYILNTRKPHYADVRVREALNLAYDFEWMNQALFYGSYARLGSYFGNTDYEAKGRPTEDELRILWELRAAYGEEAVPDGLLYDPVPEQPTTEQPHSLRENLKLARALLEEAGWTYRDGALRNVQGEPFVMVHLDSKEGSSGIHAAWVRALEKLGIRFETRSVDFSLYQDLLDNYDFDVVTIAMRGSHVLGNELNYLWGSQAADEPHNANWWGIKNPLVDDLIARLGSAPDKATAIAAGRVLDRVLLRKHYSVLQFTSHHYRVAYDQRKLAVPQMVPPYYQVENWVMGTWWALE